MIKDGKSIAEAINRALPRIDEEDIIIKDFLGVFPNAASKEYCEKVINRYEYIQETQAEWGNTGRGAIRSRQDLGIEPIKVENDTYFLGGTDGDENPLGPRDEVLISIDSPLLLEWTRIIWKCYGIYAKKYGALSSLEQQRISTTTRIQKYLPAQGYHVWHCEADDVISSPRMLTVALYLNTVEEGGETEFLYQSTRVPPRQGTVALFPAGWTHMHRGNPPLNGNKYFMTTWLHYMDSHRLTIMDQPR
tara:strand:+ start:1737 stop:2480 length:744 start_codon:yes stop_codon:yes gene_type:complete